MPTSMNDASAAPCQLPAHGFLLDQAAWAPSANATPTLSASAGHQAIFELTKGEEQYVSDLVNLERVFMKPMRTLEYITAEEEKRIFSNVKMLAEIHAELCESFKAVREVKGVESIGAILLEWVRRSAARPFKGRKGSLVNADFFVSACSYRRLRRTPNTVPTSRWRSLRSRPRCAIAKDSASFSRYAQR